MMLQFATIGLGIAAALTIAAGPAGAQKKYDEGASDTEIRIGNTGPFSGPASSYGTIAKLDAAYFRMLNEQGGINGRTIKFISLDDAYSPPKAVETTRRLVESEGVLLTFNQLGTAPNAAIQKYLNSKGVPHLFLLTGAARFIDPKGSPWSMALLPSYQVEGRIYAKHVVATLADAKIGLLSQNDDYGREFVKGFKEGLGSKVANIVAETTYEATDPTVDSQIVTLKASGATVFLNASLAKPASQAIRKAWDIGWRPVQFVISTSSGISSTLTPAGLEKAVGVITAAYLKDPRDPRWAEDSAMKDYFAFIKRYYPEGDPLDSVNASAYFGSQLMARVLKQCADNLTRENVMRQATSLKDLEMPMLLPGIRLNTSETDYALIQTLQLQRFDGSRYVPIGDPIGH